MQRGWLGVVMHFAAAAANLTAITASITPAKRKMAPVFALAEARVWSRADRAVGYSLGGNMLGCLLAEEGDRCPLDAAVIVSAPFMLEACSYHMDKGFSRVYQRYLLNLLKPTLHAS